MRHGLNWFKSYLATLKRILCNQWSYFCCQRRSADQRSPHFYNFLRLYIINTAHFLMADTCNVGLSALQCCVSVVLSRGKPVNHCWPQWPQRARLTRSESGPILDLTLASPFECVCVYVCVCVCLSVCLSVYVCVHGDGHPLQIYNRASVVQYQTREGELVRLSSWDLLLLSCQGELRKFDVVWE